MAVLSLIEDVKIVSSISTFMLSKLTLKNAFVTKQFYFEIARQTYRIFQLLQTENDFLLTNRHMIYSYGYVKLYWAVASVALFF